MKRELIKLIGGVPTLTSSDKKISGKINQGQQWIWSQFNNPGREDKFKLYHWQRKEDVNKDYEFTRFNKKIELIEFSIEEYNSLIKPNDDNWTYKETKYLWELLARFDLRFPVVYDRYDDKEYQSRTIEELKDRYYSICRKILEHRKIYDHPILKSGYNFEQENKRRTYLERTMNKLNGDQPEDEIAIKQSTDSTEQKQKRIEMIEESIKKMPIDNKDGIPFEEYLRNNVSENHSFVYLRSHKIKRNLPVSEKIQNKVDVLLKELSLPEKMIPTAEVEVAYDTLRNNLVLYTSLKKYLEKKEKESALLNSKLREMENKKNSQIIQIPQNIVIQTLNQNSTKQQPISNSKDKKKGKGDIPTKAIKV